MTDVGLLSIHELLEDEKYARFFETTPHLPDHYYYNGHTPWRLMVNVKGEQQWRSKRFTSYEDALSQFNRILPKISNAAINCPSLNFMPPIRYARVKNKIDPRTHKPVIVSRVWTPSLSGDLPQHHWCGYCRRPTIFGHKAMRPRMINGYRLATSSVSYRCSLCGANSELMDIRRPQLNQRWDVNRPAFLNG